MNFTTPQDKHMGDLKSLFSQLTGGNVAEIDICAMQNGKNVYVLLEENEKAIGFGALISYYLPTVGEIGKIEEVVIDENYRGQGLGKKLLQKLLEIAKEKKLKKVQLTSSPRREAARSMYQAAGFQIKDTNVFVLDLE